MKVREPTGVFRTLWSPITTQCEYCKSYRKFERMWGAPINQYACRYICNDCASDQYKARELFDEINDRRPSTPPPTSRGPLPSPSVVREATKIVQESDRQLRINDVLELLRIIEKLQITPIVRQNLELAIVILEPK